MWLLIIYVLFVIIGAMVPLGIGYYVEIHFSSTMSLIVFRTLFFANFAISGVSLSRSWIRSPLKTSEPPRPAVGAPSGTTIER